MAGGYGNVTKCLVKVGKNETMEIPHLYVASLDVTHR